MHLMEIEDGLCFHNQRMGMPARHVVNIPFPYMLNTLCELHFGVHDTAVSGQTDLRFC